MKKGLLCVILGTLLFTSMSGTIPATEPSAVHTHVLAVQNIYDDLNARFNRITTRQDAIAFMHEALIELNEHGLLPKGMTLHQAQRQLNQAIARAHLPTTLPTSMNGTENTNCLIFGVTTSAYFRPHPSFLDYPAFNFLLNSTFFGLMYELRILSPVKLGPYCYIGYKFLAKDNGSIVVNRIEPAKGFVFTMGFKGIEQWSGHLYGNLNITHGNVTNGRFSYDSWNMIGIRGFVGLDFLTYIAGLSNNTVPEVYFGFAHQVNMTNTPPWK